MKRSVLNNTSSLILAFVGQKIFALLFFTWIARRVGVDITGAYIFAFSYTSFFAVFIDVGFTSFLIRQIARDASSAQKLIATVLGTKFWLGILTAAAVLATIPLLHKSDLVNTMVYIAVAVMILDSFTLTFWGIFRGFQNLKYEGINVVIAQVVILLSGAVVFYGHLPPFYLAAAIMSGSLYQFMAGAVLIKKKLSLSLKPNLNFGRLKLDLSPIFKISYPFALSIILTRFYTYFDQIMLSLMKGEYDLGIYGVPYKLTFAMQFIPGALGSALFPAMSEDFIQDKNRLGRLFEKSMFYLMLVSLPITTWVLVLAQPIILQIYGHKY
ncbi:flippase, partial [Candidatus Uhrbacteria bacterium]|nr:flippase [Candidatus Uhrbacteria bacterium]